MLSENLLTRLVGEDAVGRGEQGRGRTGGGHADLLGAVLTKFSTKSAAYNYGGYDYAYDYHYGAEPEAKAGKKGKRG